MGRLKGSCCYLSGSIDASPDLGSSWRDKITPLLNDYGVQVYNPLKKPLAMPCETEFRGERVCWKQEGRYEKLATYMKYIRHIDLRLCDRSDFCVAYLDNTIQACGTWEEVFTINRQYKPCLVVCKQGKQAIPDWLFGVLPVQFLMGSFDELFEYLDYVDKAEGEDFTDLGRWVFLEQGVQL